VIDLDSTEDVSTAEAGEGTIIRCSYSAVGYYVDIKNYNSNKKAMGYKE
jgi:hypothetical protein